MSKETQLTPAEIAATFSTKKNNPPYSYEQTRFFLKAVIAEGGHIIPEELRDTKEGQRRATEQNMIGAYYVSQTTHAEIGKIYGRHAPHSFITGQAVRRTVEHGMKRLWENSSHDIKRAFPWGAKLPLGKPLSLQRRVRNSMTRGGISVRVARALQEGKSAEEISQIFGGWHKVDHVRWIIKSWGLEELPFQGLAGEAKRRLTERIQTSKTQQDLRETYTQVTIGYYRSAIRGENATLINLENVVVNCGFSARNNRNRAAFVRALESADIVVGSLERNIENGKHAGYIQHYYFIRPEDLMPANKALLADPNLIRFRVP